MARRVTHADRLQRHFYWLLDYVGASVIYNRKEANEFGGGSASIWKFRAGGRPNEAEVCLPHRIRNSVEYFVALHELGHCVENKGPRGFRFTHVPVLTSEWFAWQWALDYACIKPSRAVWADMAQAMTGYANLYVNDKRAYQDERFYALLGDARERSRK